MVSAPIQVFGMYEDKAKQRYRQLAKQCHPDTGGSDELFQRLETMWADYNSAEWMLGAGDISKVFYADHDLVEKEISNSKLNGLLLHEFEVLNKLQYQNQSTSEFYPATVELVKNKLIYCYLVANPLNLYTLESITEYYNGKIPERHLGWVWRKLLVAMDYAHSVGVIHSAITPDNILIQPYTHGLVLIDWIHASVDQSPITSVSKKNVDLYPPEKFDKDPPTPGWDIYMAATSMMSCFSPMCYELDRYFSVVADPNFRSRVSDFKTLKDTFDDVIFNLLGWKREFVIMDFPDWDEL